MNRSLLFLAALGVAGLLTATSTAHAQRGGHGGGGAAHASAAHVHVTNGGHVVVHGNNNFHNNNFHNPSVVFGFGGFYGPGYGYGYGYPYYSPYVYDPIVVTPSYAYYPPTIVQGQPGIADTQPAQPNNPAESAPKNAQIKVVVPDAAAKVWFDNNPTTSTGTERLFHTPDLTPGAANTYRIRAAWVVNGKEVQQEMIVPVQPGRGSLADFTRPPSEAVPPPPAKQ